MSKIENYKNELINRYKYLYENAVYILAPFVYRETEEDVKKRMRKLCCSEEELTYKRLIRRKDLPVEILDTLEEFLLDDIPYDETLLYNYLEIQKEDYFFLKSVSEGIALSEENLKHRKKIQFSSKSHLSLWNILEEVRHYIDEQQGDIKNKDDKIVVLDEYFRIFRYKNDGKIWTSGYKLNTIDFSNNFVTDSYPLSVDFGRRRRKRTDIGVTRNSFIEYFITNKKNIQTGSWLTEKEKQNIYLCYHDELPCDLEIICDCDTKTESCVPRPNKTEPCKKSFTIKESDIMQKPISYSQMLFDDKYYCVCPHCGYIVQISDKLLSTEIKNRIRERIIKDPFLFRRMCLYSELKQMEDNLPDEGYVKMLKKKK